MEAERCLAPGPGCRHPPPRAAGSEPAAAPVSVPAPPQGPAVGGGLAGFEFAPPQEWAGTAAGPPTPSAHIPVPAFRDPPGKVRLDEVLAAAALTNLSTSPLLLRPPAAALSTDACLEPWPQTLGQPPAAAAVEPGAGTQPASSPLHPPHHPHCPQRQPSCLGSLSLGRRRWQAEPEQSDGKEDFYYTELDIGLEVLTPVSPTASLLPTFSHLELPEPPALPSLLHPLALPPPQLLSPVAPPQGCLAPTQLQPPPSTVRACVPALSSKLSTSLRKPRGDAKKCRKVYGTEHRDLWCTACRWKKACQRFLD